MPVCGSDTWDVEREPPPSRYRRSRKAPRAALSRAAPPRSSPRPRQPPLMSHPRDGAHRMVLCSPCTQHPSLLTGQPPVHSCDCGSLSRLPLSNVLVSPPDSNFVSMACVWAEKRIAVASNTREARNRFLIRPRRKPSRKQTGCPAPPLSASLRLSPAEPSPWRVLL